MRAFRPRTRPECPVVPAQTAGWVVPYPALRPELGRWRTVRRHPTALGAGRRLGAGCPLPPAGTSWQALAPRPVPHIECPASTRHAEHRLSVCVDSRLQRRVHAGFVAAVAQCPAAVAAPGQHPVFPPFPRHGQRRLGLGLQQGLGILCKFDSAVRCLRPRLFGYGLAGLDRHRGAESRQCR